MHVQVRERATLCDDDTKLGKSEYVVVFVVEYTGVDVIAKFSKHREEGPESVFCLPERRRSTVMYSIWHFCFFNTSVELNMHLPDLR
jgi:hypothetical protein